MRLKVEKAEQIKGEVKAPPSKSLTHRALIISTLAQGNSKLYYPLYSEDTLASLKACEAMGAEINVQDRLCQVQGTAGVLKTPEDVLDVKNSGTTLRFMTSVAALTPQWTVITGDPSLRRRPMQHLLEALKGLGVTAFSSQGNGLPPIIVKGGFKGGKTSIRGDLSSQYLSSLLISSPYAQEEVEVQVLGELKSSSYVNLTRQVMEYFQITIEYDGENNIFFIEPGIYESQEYTIEGDFSSASYLIAAAAILESDLTINNLFADTKQGDRIILDIIKNMGADVHIDSDRIRISSDGELDGVEVDLSNAPDLLPTIAALGALAQGETVIYGVEHARYKETDRIHTMALELRKLGVEVEEMSDGLRIRGEAKSGVVNSHGDHRLVMALYLIGLKIGEVQIEDAEAYQVSFPHFPETMNRLVGRV